MGVTTNNSKVSFSIDLLSFFPFPINFHTLTLECAQVIATTIMEGVTKLMKD